MLLYYHSWMFYNHYIVILYHFLVLTYWHSAQCQLFFSACFLHHRKSIPNGVQAQRNFLWIFLAQKISSGPGTHLRGAPRRAQPTRECLGAQARPGGLCPPRWPPAPPLCSINSPIFQKPYGSRRKSVPAAVESRTTKSNLDTITRGSPLPLMSLWWCMSSSL